MPPGRCCEPIGTGAGRRAVAISATPAPPSGVCVGATDEPRLEWDLCRGPQIVINSRQAVIDYRRRNHVVSASPAPSTIATVMAGCNDALV